MQAHAFSRMGAPLLVRIQDRDYALKRILDAFGSRVELSAATTPSLVSPLGLIRRHQNKRKR
jgi:hypothetical protein